MPSNPFLPGASADTARWLPGTQGLWNHTFIQQSDFLQQEAFFLSPTKKFFFLLLCYLWHFSPFFGVCFLFLRIQDPLAQQDSILDPSSSPTFPSPCPAKVVGRQSPVQTDCFGPQCRPLAGDHRANRSKCHW